MKRPSFQFYPGDWQRDIALRACSVPARGLWLEIICIMHQADPYGHLVLNGLVIDIETLATMVGCSTRSAAIWLAELEKKGVCSKENGIVVCRRMIRDEKVRAARAAGGNLGGNPKLIGKKKVVDKDNLPSNLQPTPSSSSSSSTSIHTSKAIATPPGFTSFWEAWPKHERKGAKTKCLNAWKTKGYESRLDEIVRHVTAMKRSEDWLMGFVPAPLVYLNQARFDGADVDAMTPKPRARGTLDFEDINYKLGISDDGSL